MQITEEIVLKALGTVIDPDFKKDLVSLNMIKDLKIDGSDIYFTIELTTPACPLKDQLERDSRNAIKDMVSATATVHLEFSSRVTTLRDFRSDVLPGVKNIIAVSSGKGGVGKSTVSVNLALALQRSGAKVGLIDADIHGPSIPTMLGLKGLRPGIENIDGKPKIVPLYYKGLKVISIGFLVEEGQAIAWRGPMVTSALRQFITDCVWGELDYIVLDMPPGTGDIQLTLAQIVPVTGAVIVTTPQEVALADARKAIAFYNIESVKIPIIGIVENMAYFTPAELPDNKYYIFGRDGGKSLAAEYSVPFLGEVPLVQAIREGGDMGVPAVLDTDTVSANAFESLASNIARNIVVKNAEITSVEAS
ncbi:MAG: Mrp/NBP35 family ATP-binding protein [Chitinophagales bacterium]|nr:Mrp/NBP35 family ATP-binding protein [Chitinophagales bacterium]